MSLRRLCKLTSIRRTVPFIVCGTIIHSFHLLFLSFAIDCRVLFLREWRIARLADGWTRQVRAFSASPNTTDTAKVATEPATVSKQPSASAAVTPQSRAQALLALLPGETLFAKTAYATMGSGLAAFLVSKGIYIPNEETLVLAAFAVTMRALYVKLSGPVSAYLEASINELRERWVSSSLTEKDMIRRQIDEMESFRDHTDVTASFYATRRENIQMQAELDTLLSTNQFISGIKQRLDEQVRKEQERAAIERRERAEALIASLHEALRDPKTQDAILRKCLADLEKTPVRNLA